MLGDGTKRFEVYGRARIRDKGVKVYVRTLAARRDAEAADEEHASRSAGSRQARSRRLSTPSGRWETRTMRDCARLPTGDRTTSTKASSRARRKLRDHGCARQDAARSNRCTLFETAKLHAIDLAAYLTAASRAAEAGEARPPGGSLTSRSSAAPAARSNGQPIAVRSMSPRAMAALRPTQRSGASASTCRSAEATSARSIATSRFPWACDAQPSCSQLS